MSDKEEEEEEQFTKEELASQAESRMVESARKSAYESVEREKEGKRERGEEVE